MKTFYGDDSYFKSNKEIETNNITLFGGFLIEKEDEKKLIEIIQNNKGKYTHINMPIKWNMKDTSIKETYNEFKKTSNLEDLIKNSREFRLNLIRDSLSINYKIICSCIQQYSIKRDVNLKTKELVFEYMFENLITRIGNEAKSYPDQYQIVLDWPHNNNPKPYNRNYYYMYNSKKTYSGNNNMIGPLMKLNFSPSLLFAQMNHNPLLQFADILIGALKDTIEMKLQNRDNCLGKECIDLVKNKFRSSKNGKIVGYGIAVASGNQELRKQIEEII